MRDTIDTALSFGLSASSAQLEVTPFTLDALYQPEHPDAQHFLDFLNDWLQLTTMLNEMSRSMGQPDFYPFILPHLVVAKLHFIHLLVTSASWLTNDLDVLHEAQQQMDEKIQGAIHAPEQSPTALAPLETLQPLPPLQPMQEMAPMQEMQPMQEIAPLPPLEFPLQDFNSDPSQNQNQKQNLNGDKPSDQGQNSDLAKFKAN